MKCPYCFYYDSKVIDTRTNSEVSSIRRRRECLSCKNRYTTYEYIEEPDVFIKKRNGSIEKFDRKKVLDGILRACVKRQIETETLDRLIDEIECLIKGEYSKKITSEDVGNIIMQKLKRIDEVAYIRFASVYKKFENLEQFKEELEHIEQLKIENNKNEIYERDLI